MIAHTHTHMHTCMYDIKYQKCSLSEGMDRKYIFIVLLYLRVALGLQGKNMQSNERLLSFEQSNMQQVTWQTMFLVPLTQPSEYDLGPIMLSLKGRICNLKWGWTSL